MKLPDAERAQKLRRVVDDFLTMRLAEKLKQGKAEGGADEQAAKREQLRQQFEFSTWIADAARRVAWIQLVTHSVKPIHPSAGGTNLFLEPNELPDHPLVGTQCLGARFDADVVGNAAALDVYKFLRLRFEGHTLLELMRADDPDIPAALCNDAANGLKLKSAFTSIVNPRGTVSSHTLAKQLYWLTGVEPEDDSNYHLLAPLFSTSLTHRVFQLINNDRFSDDSKTARAARRAGQFSEHVVHDYPNLVVQQIGGTKPQNISQLNSERGGANCLLVSLPPRWRRGDVRPLFHTESMFPRFEKRDEVREGVKKLAMLLEANPVANATTRGRRDVLVHELLGELLVYSAELRAMAPGWSNSPDCKLSAAERQWLDPYGGTGQAEPLGASAPDNCIEKVSQAFGLWLNRQLRDPLPMGDPEYQHWYQLARACIEDSGWEAGNEPQ